MPGSEPSPPVAPRRPTSLVTHGDERVDDWYWLRDRDDPSVIAHLEAENAYTEEMQRLRLRLEDKGPIVAFHWRGTPDEEASRTRLEGLAAEAEAGGLATHWGRKVLEVRPPVPLDKGRGVRRLLAGRELAVALYVGDDLTDLDAFAGLRGLVEVGELGCAICVGVRSDETPAALEEAADLLVDGPPGVRGLLMTLAE